MRKKSVRIALAVVLASLPGIVQAQPSSHYVPGIEGIKGSSLPPPGWYVRDYNVGYYSTELNTAANKDTHIAGVQAFCYANVPRLIWITDEKILGGYLGADVVLPITYQSLTIPGEYNHATAGIGDFFTEATLSWHVKRFDYAIGVGEWMPTGDANTPTEAGMGFWTTMFSAGATYYFDEEKTWSLSALSRYEVNGGKNYAHLTPGETYTLEWGLGKTFAKVWEVGPVGYYQQEVTPDGGKPAWTRSRVAAIGPEINVAFPKIMVFVALRTEYEFMAESRLQGETTALVLTKRF